MNVYVLPDTEALVLHALRAYLPTGTAVRVAMPQHWAGLLPLVVARRVGGKARDPRFIDSGMFTVEALAASRPAASLLARQARGALLAACRDQHRGSDGYLSRFIEVTGPFMTGDALTAGHPGACRFTATYQLNARPLAARPPLTVTLAADRDDGRYYRAQVVGAAAGPARLEWGDGHMADITIGADPVVVEHEYKTLGAHTVTVTDADGNTKTVTTAPVLPVEISWAMDAGSNFEGVLSATGVKPGVTVDWGDGSPPVTPAVSAGKLTERHAFTADGEKTITVAVPSWKDAGFEGHTASAKVTVRLPRDLDVQLGYFEDDPRKVSATIRNAVAGKGQITWGD
ncbi:hypothetical protein [Streptomyces sp. UNOB3_S3]|uniref:hypothetical protein n=1 Tax=Streptomyces sp. UNOB3_S3 TaxID=2871682 RepID=UPI001E63E2E1|nr:hypothetical protein [Streptomyces sp. UNOB3_S3]MCC3773485.1 hypothetical protein [Streptomyces sp. UNOB3_S3]